ncbi:MAG: hypothetical protein QM582_10135 [Micropruina sp.]|uniref:hypothetical protein n=1 Tax=Micropruina sp. TaxID=2737536 RepID=UPI0039E64197
MTHIPDDLSSMPPTTGDLDDTQRATLEAVGAIASKSPPSSMENAAGIRRNQGELNMHAHQILASRGDTQ